MDKKTFEKLEADYLADCRTYDNAEFQLYDYRNEAQRNFEQTQNYIGELEYQLQDPSLNYTFNNLQLDLEDSYEEFKGLIRRKEDLLEDYRWENKKRFAEKTEKF